MGSECRHAGRALCRCNKSYCSPKLELIFPRGNNQAKPQKNTPCSSFLGALKLLRFPSHPHPHAQHRSQKGLLLASLVCRGREAEWSHTYNKSIAVGFVKLMYLIKNFKNCIKLKSMMQQIRRLTL